MSSLRLYVGPELTNTSAESASRTLSMVSDVE
jgi:hypothetical protein